MSRAIKRVRDRIFCLCAKCVAYAGFTGRLVPYHAFLRHNRPPCPHQQHRPPVDHLVLEDDEQIADDNSQLDLLATADVDNSQLDLLATADVGVVQFMDMHVDEAVNEINGDLNGDLTDMDGNFSDFYNLT